MIEPHSLLTLTSLNQLNDFYKNVHTFSDQYLLYSMLFDLESFVSALSCFSKTGFRACCGGLACKLRFKVEITTFNEYFNIIILKIGLGPETGQCSKGRLQFLTPFLSNASQPETLKRYSQILYQNVPVKRYEPVSGTVI